MSYGKALSFNNDHLEAIKILNEAKKHINTYSVEIALSKSYKDISNYKKAEEALVTACYMMPNRFYSHYLLIKLYEETNECSKMIKLAKELLKKEVKIPSPAIKEIKEEIQSLINLNQYELRLN